MSVTIIGKHSYDYLSASNVETGSYAPIDDGASVSNVKAIRGSLTKSDYLSATFAISSSDVPWNVWNISLGAEELEINGELTMRGAVWIVMQITERPDGAQTRAICRKKR